MLTWCCIVIIAGAESVFEMPQPVPSSRITHRHKNGQHEKENRDRDDEAIDMTL